MEKIDLLLVNPSNKKQVYGKLGPDLACIEPPLWTGLIASFVREKGVIVKIIDADAQGWDAQITAEKIIEINPLVCGIGVIGANPSASSTPKMPATANIVEILKEKSPNIKIILYGIHPSALPEKTLGETKTDFVCKGESFYTILEIVRTLKKGEFPGETKIPGLWYINNGTLVANGWGRLVENLDDMPFVAWDLLPMDKYRAHNWHCFGHLDKRQSYAIVYTSFGCPFSCTYCNIKALYDGKPGIRFRSPKKVVDEIEFLVKEYKVKNIKILDELFVLNEARLMEFCDLVIEKNFRVNFWAYARVDTVNAKVLAKMKKAGINWLAYGIEAGSKKVREGVVKGRFDHAQIKKVMDMTRVAGIYVIGNFMFGLPDDDFETMQDTLNLAKELQCEYVNFYTTMAYPGSLLYEELANKAAVSDNWIEYSQFNYQTKPLSTKYLSSAEVLRFRDKAFNEYYNDSNYLKMMENKFGKETVEHIKQMMSYNIKRRLLDV